MAVQKKTNKQEEQDDSLQVDIPIHLLSISSDFMKDVGMPTCKLSSCSSCLFVFLYRHPYFIHNLFNCFLYLFVLFLYDCKSSSIAMYSQDEVVTCISSGIICRIYNVISLVPRPHPSLREGEGLVKNRNIPGPEAGIWESQSDRSICN